MNATSARPRGQQFSDGYGRDALKVPLQPEQIHRIKGEYP